MFYGDNVNFLLVVNYYRINPRTGAKVYSTYFLLLGWVGQQRVRTISIKLWVYSCGAPCRRDKVSVGSLFLVVNFVGMENFILFLS